MQGYAYIMHALFIYAVASFTEMTPQLLGLPGVTCFFLREIIAGSS